MERAGLLPVERVAPADAESLRLLDAAARRAKDLFLACLALPPEEQAALLAGRAFLFRRWVLETILATRFRAPVTYGELARALAGEEGARVPSGSLSPKLRELHDAGLLDRIETGDALGRVQYRLPDAAAPLGDAVYTLATAKALQTVAVLRGEGAPAIGDFAAPLAPPAALPFDGAARAYAAAARAFAAHHAGRQMEAGFETALESASRFTEACDRKWQGSVMIRLLQAPASFATLRRDVGLGDQALSLALRELQASRAVARDEEGTYRLAPYAFYDMSFGVSALALLPASARSKAPA